MFRTFIVIGIVLIGMVGPAAPVFADGKIGLHFPLELPARPTSITTALPYVRLVHEVLDTLTSSDAAPVMRAKLMASETRSEWVVHRIKANVWVERTSSNYLGQVGVRVAIPCYVEFSFDMGALRFGQAEYDPLKRRLVVQLPPVQMRQPVPLLDEMKIDPHYKGLRGTLLDADKVRRLQEELVKEDYLPAAREAALEVYDHAQAKAREQVQEFLRTIFKQANADVEVVVK